MSNLGGTTGQGTHVQRCQDLVRAYYDFDSYMTQRSRPICNGEIQSSASVLGAIFGLLDFQLHADYNRVHEIQL